MNLITRSDCCGEGTRSTLELSQEELETLFTAFGKLKSSLKSQLVMFSSGSSRKIKLEGSSGKILLTLS